MPFRIAAHWSLWTLALSATTTVAYAQTPKDTVSTTKVIFGPADSCTQVYSPTVVRDPSNTFHHLWIGGWRNCAEQNSDGNDKIFHATSTDLQNWSFDAAPVITSPSMHFNDPSVVIVDYPAGQPGARKVFLMYMTGCTTAATCFSPGGNHTYGATSWDGVTWSAPQLVIGQNNGATTYGAWSPSALRISNSTLWLYYHDSNGLPLRSIISPQVNFFAATPAVPVSVPVTGPFAVNLDVTRTLGGTYEMLYDFADADPTFRVYRLMSSDGLTFTQDNTFFGVDGRGLSPPHRALTGHIVNVDATHYWLYFGWAQAPSSAPISVHGWYATRPSPR